MMLSQAHVVCVDKGQCGCFAYVAVADRMPVQASLLSQFGDTSSQGMLLSSHSHDFQNLDVDVEHSVSCCIDQKTPARLSFLMPA